MESEFLAAKTLSAVIVSVLKGPHRHIFHFLIRKIQAVHSLTNQELK